MSLRSNLVWFMKPKTLKFQSKITKRMSCGFQLCLESKHYCQESFDYQPKRCYCQRESIKMSIHLHPFALFDPPKRVFEWSLPKLNKFDESLRSFRWRFCLFIFTQLKTALAVWREQCWLSTRAIGKKTSSGNAVQNLFRQDTMNKHRIQIFKFPWCLHTFWWAVS